MKRMLNFFLFFLIATSFSFSPAFLVYSNPVGIIRILASRGVSSSVKNIPTGRMYRHFAKIPKRRYSASRNIRIYNLPILNKKYAGSYYPVKKLPVHIRKKYPESVRFDRNGYPDFSPYAKKKISSNELTGQYANDFSIANQKAGYSSTPEGFTWHHHQNGRDMLLVPKDLHHAVRHSGGRSYLQRSSQGR